MSTSAAFFVALASSASFAASADEAKHVSLDVDDSLKLNVSGYVQADTRFFDQASVDDIDPGTGQPLNAIAFTIRRAELMLDAKRDLKFVVVGATIELVGSTAHGPALALGEAEATAAWPGKEPLLAGSVGIMHIPFGVEATEPITERLFLEESNLTRAMFPGDLDLGMRLRGQWSFLRYALAAMNGNPIGDPTFPLRAPSRDKDVLGRVGVDFDVVDSVNVRAGVSGLSGVGFHVGQRPTKDTLVWRDANEDGLVQASELTAIGGTSGTASEVFHHGALGADARVQWDVPVIGTLSVDGDVTLATNLDRALQPADPIVVGHDLRELGWRVAVTQQLSKFVYVGVRYDEYNPDLDALDTRAGTVVPTDATVSTWSFAAAVLWPHVGKLLAEYDHNDNALGVDVNGVPTTLASDTFAVRAQAEF
jgi:hypothetical protein